MIAINSNHTPFNSTERDFLRENKTNVLVYADRKRFEDLEVKDKDSTVYITNALRQSPEKYNVGVSYNRDASLAREADVVFSRFDPLEDSESVAMHRAFLEELVQYEEGRKFYNAPSAQLKFTDKRYLKNLIGTDIMADAFFTTNPQKAVEFMRYLGTGVFVKPIFGSGGHGIQRFDNTEYVKAGDYVDYLLKNGQDEVFVQRSIDEVLTEGDKRVIVVDGEAIGAILRRPKEGSYLANIHSGGSAEDAVVTPRDLRVIEVAMQYLPELKSGFWGLDIIGDYLGEANGNSPGLGAAIDKSSETSIFRNSILRGVDGVRELKLVA